ncbi:DUF4157 domain-containing protein [Paenibacillus piri]|uniref:DUF4157 domain-containing protein n=1 Tax=Paenibacillus piri TaxID=2547395 RepID=A0A4R5KQV3_9BACL|nr:DUF4157 domain-containing protein [Paenibacillus piri]TDF97147.1 DUF4157 domain-containing protein [Paenibacillus piri]
MPIHQPRQNGKLSAAARIQRKAETTRSGAGQAHAPNHPHQVTAAGIMNLHGSIGNRSVQRMIASSQTRLPIQAKMSVGPVGDQYEQEADKVASQVVQQLQMKPTAESIQRMEQPEAEEEELQMKPTAETIQRMEQPEAEGEELQMKPVSESIQRMEQPEAEEEELQMKPAAETIQRMEQPEAEEKELQMKPAAETIQRMEQPEAEEEELQMKPAAGSIQRMEQPEVEEEELQMKPMAETIQRMSNPDEEQLQMKPSDGSGFDVTSSFEQRIQAKSGGGAKMDSTTRSGMEQAFGADFSNVSIHNDSESNELNQDIGAQAFTQGQDVFFSSGKYEPSSPQGQELLAHELTHVVQQRGG